MATSFGHIGTAEQRAGYWTQRYEHPDWSDGIHIGQFLGLPADATLAEGSAAADEALIREILETCSVFRLMTEFRVLEVGCGAGGLAFRLSAALPHLVYRGCDISQSAIASANSKARSNRIDTPAGRPPDLCFNEGGFDSLLDFTTEALVDKSKGFDLIIIREVYYLLSPSERTSLATMASQILRPGGFLYFSDLFCVSSNARPVVQRTLYDRHHSRGDILELNSSAEESVMKWMSAEFGDKFLPLRLRPNIDVQSIGHTYVAALKLPIENPENSSAYEQLVALSKSGDSAKPSLVYVRCFLFHTEVDAVSVLGDGDFQFCAHSSFQEVLKQGRRYGVRRNHWNLILGRSGEGKTSLLRALAGELPTVTGDLTPLSGELVFSLSQVTDIFDNLSPIDNVVAFGAEKNQARQLLQQLGMAPRALNNRSSRKLSGGEQQKVAIAQCLASSATTIVMDEPLRGLDKPRRVLLFEMLNRHLREIGEGTHRTLVCVDHDFESIYQRFDVVFEMLNGFQVPLWLNRSNAENRK